MVISLVFRVMYDKIGTPFGRERLVVYLRIDTEIFCLTFVKIATFAKLLSTWPGV